MTTFDRVYLTLHLRQKHDTMPTDYFKVLYVSYVLTVVAVVNHVNIVALGMGS